MRTSVTRTSWQPAEHGSPAYSAIANTLRSINGVDMLLVTADAFATSVYAGDYTEAQLSDLLNERRHVLPRV